VEIWETHCHTSEVSGCGKSTGAEMAKAYAKAGYTGIVITDHFEINTFRDCCPYENPQDMVKWYLSGSQAAKEAAVCKVLWGIELRFTENTNDYLVYGLTEEQLVALCRDHVFEWGIKQFSHYAKQRGILLFQAHPFRNGMMVNRPELLYGIEIFNGHPNHDSRNQMAQWWAEHYGLARISGSDAHHINLIATGGIMTDKTIQTMEDFCQVISETKTKLLMK